MQSIIGRIQSSGWQEIASLGPDYVLNCLNEFRVSVAGYYHDCLSMLFQWWPYAKLEIGTMENSMWLLIRIYLVNYTLMVEAATDT